MKEVKLDNLDLMHELVRQKEAAEKSNIDKSRFLAAASHDLRQPMHALGLFMATLRERIHQPELRSMVDTMGASIEAMEDLFTALLDVSRLDAGVIQPQTVDFSLFGMLERVRNEFEGPCAKKGLRLSVRPQAARVHSDPALVERILRNFVSNALRYTHEGSIVVGLRRGSHLWRLEVWDTGVGIPKNKQRDIFQEFVQLNNPERDRSQGLGLGLAIVGRMAKLLRHPIHLRSKPGLGSLFAIDLPVAAGAEFEQSPMLSLEDNPAVIAISDRFAGSLVVVVEDDEAIRNGMAVLLQGWGCEVIAVASGEEVGIRLLQQAGPPDLIITDYRLGGIETGVQVIRRLHKEFNQLIPSILITGDTTPERIKEARSSGFQLLHKPLQAARLRLVMAKLLQEESSPVAW